MVVPTPDVFGDRALTSIEDGGVVGTFLALDDPCCAGEVRTGLAGLGREKRSQPLITRVPL